MCLVGLDPVKTQKSNTEMHKVRDHYYVIEGARGESSCFSQDHTKERIKLIFILMWKFEERHSRTGFQTSEKGCCSSSYCFGFFGSQRSNSELDKVFF